MNTRQAQKHTAEAERIIASLLGPLGEPVLLAVPGVICELTDTTSRSPRFARPPRALLAVTPTRLVLAGKHRGRYALTVPFLLLTLGELEISHLHLQWIQPDESGMYLDFQSDHATEFFAALKELRDDAWMQLPRHGQVEMADHSYGHGLHFRRRSDPAAMEQFRQRTAMYVSGEIDAGESRFHLGVVSSPVPPAG